MNNEDEQRQLLLLVLISTKGDRAYTAYATVGMSNGERERIEITFGLPIGYLASLPQLMNASKLKDSREVRRMFEYVLTHMESCCLPKDNQIYEAILAEKREYLR